MGLTFVLVIDVGLFLHGDLAVKNGTVFASNTLLPDGNAMDIVKMDFEIYNI